MEKNIFYLNKEKNKHLKQKTISELHDSFIKETPVFTSNFQARDALVQTFAERFEDNIKPRFTKEMGLQGESMKDPEVVFNSYASWLLELLSELGIKIKTTHKGSEHYFDLLNCPWIDEANNNPIFCHICQAMVLRSFTWTSLKGNVEQTSSIADVSGTCKFKFHIVPLSKEE